MKEKELKKLIKKLKRNLKESRIEALVLLNKIEKLNKKHPREQVL